MPKEKEVKVLNVDVGALQEQLRELGAKRNFPFTKMPELAFDRSKSHLRKKGILLRLRSVGARAELTVKGKGVVGKLIVRDEINCGIDDFKAMKKLLKALGYTKIWRDREKKREEWFLPSGEKVDIDRWPIGEPYAEIEGKNWRAILRAIKALGLERNELAAKTSTELLRLWGAKDPNHIKF